MHHRKSIVYIFSSKIKEKKYLYHYLIENISKLKWKKYVVNRYGVFSLYLSLLHSLCIFLQAWSISYNLVKGSTTDIYFVGRCVRCNAIVYIISKRAPQHNYLLHWPVVCACSTETKTKIGKRTKCFLCISVLLLSGGGLGGSSGTVFYQV